MPAAQEYLTKAYAIMDRVEQSGGFLSSDEEAEVRGLLHKARGQGEVDGILGQISAASDGGTVAGGPGAPADPGSRFLDSPGYKDLFGPGSTRGDTWSTGLVEIAPPPAPMFKGTLGESGVGNLVGGGALVSVPQLVPGAVQTLFQPLTFETLVDANVADSPTVRFIVEGTATSGATGVAEGGTKPESTIGLTYTDEQVRKIATFLPVSEELLEDGPAIQAYLNGRLSLFVNVATETQLFRGAAGGPGIQGLLTSRGVPVYTGLTSDDKPTQLFKALNSMRGSALIEPDWVAIHPTDYQVMRLLRDGAGGTAGQYMGGGPFLGAYGNAGPVSASGQVAGFNDTIWGKPVYVTANIGGAGTALIGTRANAAVWSRGGLRVEASNSHSNYFQINLVAIRAERRLALTVYRPTGFVECRLAVGPGG